MMPTPVLINVYYDFWDSLVLVDGLTTDDYLWLLRDAQGETALEIAAVRGHMSVVNVLK